MFDRGMVHTVVAGDIVDHYCFIFDRGVVHIVVAGYNVDHYCFILTEEWFILLWVVILLPITV
jgi:ABC-type iron transport system FetAB permease component